MKHVVICNECRLRAKGFTNQEALNLVRRHHHENVDYFSYDDTDDLKALLRELGEVGTV